MGQQQLLLVILGIIIVGVAVMLAISIYKQKATENKTDVILNETQYLASLAIQYYKKAKTFGGGEYNYLGWTIPEEFDTTHNGFYSVQITPPDQCIITGISNEAVTGGDSIKVVITLNGTNMQTHITN
jgi:hypothetical protein